MKIAGWALLALGALVLVAANPMIGAGVSMVMLGATLLAQ